MKIVFIARLFNAIATEAAAPVLNSDKLTELRQAYTTKWQEIGKLTDPFAKETKDAKLALYKLDGEIAAEENRIRKEQKDAEIAELRNQRIQLNDKQLAAHLKYVNLAADKKAKPEDVQTALDEFNTAKELVNNELLAKYANSAAGRKPKAEGETGDKTSSANTAQIIEMYLAGKSHAEIQEAGFARSTVWHAINKYKKANEVPA